jgi:hypothetical protein
MSKIKIYVLYQNFVKYNHKFMRCQQWYFMLKIQIVSLLLTHEEMNLPKIDTGWNYNNEPK